MTRDDIIRMAKKAELHCHMNLTESGAKSKVTYGL